MEISNVELTKVEGEGGQGRDLTAEEYNEMIKNTSVMATEDYQLMIVEDKAASLQLWKTILKKFKGSGVPIRDDLKVKSKKWQSKPDAVICMIVGVTTQNTECIALISRQTPKSKFWIDSIMVMNAVSTQSFAKMMISALKSVAKDKGTEVMIPKCYAAYSTSESTSLYDQSDEAYLQQLLEQDPLDIICPEAHNVDLSESNK